MSFEFHLPPLGEGVKSGTIISLLVKDGEKVKKDQDLLEIETDKAMMPVPSPAEGVIRFKIKEKQDIKIGDLIAVLETSDAKPVSASSPSKEQENKTTEPTKITSASSASSVQIVTLPPLGEGVKGGTVITVYVKVGDIVKKDDPIIELETEKASMPLPSPFAGKIEELSISVGKDLKIGESVCKIRAEGVVAKSINSSLSVPTPANISAEATKTVAVGVIKPASISGDRIVRAGPATRKFARENGVDLSLVNGTKKFGRIDIQDVQNYLAQRGASGSASVVAVAQPLPDFTRFGNVRSEPLPKIRKIISERMTYNWNHIPHVFQFQDVDITGITELGKKYSEEFKEKGSTASPTNFFIKAMVHCLQAFPKFNASLDDVTGELVLKEYYNIGVAVDTPAGLIVPVLRNVDKMSIFEIGKSLREMAAKGRDRKITPDEMTGACLTLSNLGGIGGTSFTPIVNWPEVAILGVAKAQIKPVWVDNAFVPRTVVTICLSYDHRVIDGADAARFVVKFKDLIENYEKSLMGAV